MPNLENVETRKSGFWYLRSLCLPLSSFLSFSLVIFVIFGLSLSSFLVYTLEELLRERACTFKQDVYYHVINKKRRVA